MARGLEHFVLSFTSFAVLSAIYIKIWILIHWGFKWGHFWCSGCGLKYEIYAWKCFLCLFVLSFCHSLRVIIPARIILMKFFGFPIGVLLALEFSRNLAIACLVFFIFFSLCSQSCFTKLYGATKPPEGMKTFHDVKSVAY